MNSNRKWTGASSASASIDEDFTLIIHKITSKSLNLTYNSTVITLKARVVVGTYVGVGSYGIVKIGSQTINSTINWYADKNIPIPV